MRPFGRVAQITPYPFSHHGQDMAIGRQASHQESALNAGRDLGGNIARALIADGELALFRAITNYVFKPIEIASWQIGAN